MTEIAVRRPYMRTRIWDRDYNLLFDSDTSDIPPNEWLRNNLDGQDWLPVTLDQEKIRWSGRVYKAVSDQLQFESDYEHLKYMSQPTFEIPEGPAA